MKTERALEMIRDFRKHGISHEPGKGLDAVLNFQDIIGRSTPREITEFYRTLDNIDDRQSFFWAISRTLDFDSFIQILKSTTILMERERLYEDFDKDCLKREMALSKAEQTLEDGKRTIYNRIRRVERERDTLVDKISRLESQLSVTRDRNRELSNTNREYRNKAARFDNIRAALDL